MNFITKLFKSKKVSTAYDLEVIKRLAFLALFLFKQTRRRSPGKIAAERIVQRAIDISMADGVILSGHVLIAFNKLSK